MNFHEIWYAYYAIADYHKIINLQFPTRDKTDITNEQTCEVGSTLTPYAVGPQIADFRDVHNFSRVILHIV
jgi:hypothetical protein